MTIFTILTVPPYFVTLFYNVNCAILSCHSFYNINCAILLCHSFDNINCAILFCNIFLFIILALTSYFVPSGLRALSRNQVSTINGVFSLLFAAVTFPPEGVLVGFPNFAWGYIGASGNLLS